MGKIAKTISSGVIINRSKCPFSKNLKSMHPMKKLIIISILVSVLVLTQSCFEDINDISYQGPPLVEFSHLTHENAFWTNTGSHWSTTILGDVNNASLQVSNLGAQQPTDQEIGYYVAQQLYLDQQSNKLKVEQPEHNNWVFVESTATAGVDYNILDDGVVIIPANNSFGTISIELSPTNNVYLYLVLEKRDLAPSDNYKFFRLTLFPD